MTDDDKRNMAIFWALVIAFIIAGLFLAQPASADFGIGDFEAGAYQGVKPDTGTQGTDLALEFGYVEKDWPIVGNVIGGHKMYGDLLWDVGDGLGMAYGISISHKPIARDGVKDNHVRLLGALTDDFEPTFGISLRYKINMADWLD